MEGYTIPLHIKQFILRKIRRHAFYKFDAFVYHEFEFLIGVMDLNLL